MLKENKEFFLMVIGIMLSMIALIFVFRFISPGSDAQRGEYSSIISNFFSFGNKDYEYSSQPSMKLEDGKDYQAVIRTTKGDIKINFYQDNAPQTVNNFVFLAEEGYYDGVLFHRVKKDYIIQSGDRNTLDDDIDNDGQGGPGYTFDDEINWDSLGFSEAKKQELKNVGYSSTNGIVSKHLEQKSVAMANGGPNTNGSQFFIVVAQSNDPDIKRLDGRHTVFGKVIEGWDVVLQISDTKVDSPNSSSPRPLEDIKIESIEIITL